MKKYKIDYSKLIPMEEIDKEIGWTKEELAGIEKGALKIIKRMELREQRKKKAMTQDALAKKAKLPRSTIARIEAGKGNPQIDTLKQIAKAMGMELEVKFVEKKR